MDTKTLMGKSRQALVKELEDAVAHLKELQFRLSSNQLKDVRDVRNTKKLVARIKTILNQSTEEIANT